MFSELQVIRNGTIVSFPMHFIVNFIRREIPTQPALSVPTPEPTPQHADTDPFQVPPNTRSGEAGADESYKGADRGFLSVRRSLVVSGTASLQVSLPGSSNECSHGWKA